MVFNHDWDIVFFIQHSMYGTSVYEIVSRNEAISGMESPFTASRTAADGDILKDNMLDALGFVLLT